MPPKATSFEIGDVVLAKLTGYPDWPAIIKPCIVEEGDESYAFKYDHYRSPDLYWVLFFEDSDEPETGFWVNASDIKSYTCKIAPSDVEDSKLLEAHKHADGWVQKFKPSLAQDFYSRLAGLGQNPPTLPPTPNQSRHSSSFTRSWNGQRLHYRPCLSLSTNALRQRRTLTAKQANREIDGNFAIVDNTRGRRDRKDSIKERTTSFILQTATPVIPKCLYFPNSSKRFVH